MSYASDALIDALQRKVDRLEVENYLLRTAGGHASLTVARQSGKKDTIIALAERVEELDAENAKLRELVGLMHRYMDESCAVQHTYPPKPVSYASLLKAEKRMHELGVEVK